MSNKVKMELPDGSTSVETMELPDGSAPVETQEEKIPYDKLYQIAIGLNKTNQELQMRLNEVSLGNFFTRLEFLFKVVKFADKFPEDFVKVTVDEIVESMTIDKQEPNEEK